MILAARAFDFVVKLSVNQKMDNDPDIQFAIVKGKVYKTVVRPAMMYGAERWAVKKGQENKLDVTEIRMLDG